MIKNRVNLSDNLPARKMEQIPAKIVKPITDGIITSGYGERISPITGKKEFHAGLDISVVGNSTNIPVLVAKSGVIKWVDHTRVYDPKTGQGSFGMVVYVLMPDGFYSIYPHMDSISISAMIGVIVEAGTQIGVMGNTGLSKGRHLHYQERTTLDTSGKSRNPLDISDLYK